MSDKKHFTFGQPCGARLSWDAMIQDGESSLAGETGSGLLKDLRGGDPHPARISLIMGRAADEIERLRASMAAIHWNSARADADRATLMAIHSECERAVPELKTILSPNGRDQRRPTPDTKPNL